MLKVGKGREKRREEGEEEGRREEGGWLNPNPNGTREREDCGRPRTKC